MKKIKRVTIPQRIEKMETHIRYSRNDLLPPQVRHFLLYKLMAQTNELVNMHNDIVENMEVNYRTKSNFTILKNAASVLSRNIERRVGYINEIYESFELPLYNAAFVAEFGEENEQA